MFRLFLVLSLTFYSVNAFSQKIISQSLDRSNTDSFVVSKSICSDSVCKVREGGALLKNIGGVDRLVRSIVGIVLLYFAFSGHIWGWIGVVPIFTATVGYCPVYQILGISTRRCSSNDSNCCLK